jgi:hypothetical protein
VEFLPRSLLPQSMNPWTNLLIIIINYKIYIYISSTYKLPPVQKSLVHLFKVKFQNMNRMNLLFYKAFLPSFNLVQTKYDTL